MILLVYLLSVVFEQQVSCESSPPCEAWSMLEHNLKSKYQSIVCNKLNNCSGMKCSGTLEGDEIHTSIEVNHCENPVNILLTADIPKLGINAWRKTFSHGEHFNLSDYINCNFSLQNEKDNVTIGLDIELKVSNKYLLHLLDAPTKISVFHDVVIPLPPCSRSSEIENISSSSARTMSSSTSTPGALISSDLKLEQGNCSINNSTCGPLEICKQIDTSRFDGNCVCVSDYVRDQSGRCMYSPSVETSSNAPHHATPSTKKEPSNMAIMGVKAAVLTGAAIGGSAVALPLLGFTAAGVAAGSLAAGYQATLGGTVIAGSGFSVLQSVGVVELAGSTQAAIGAVSTVIAILI